MVHAGPRGDHLPAAGATGRAVHPDHSRDQARAAKDQKEEAQISMKRRNSEKGAEAITFSRFFRIAIELAYTTPIMFLPKLVKRPLLQFFLSDDKKMKQLHNEI